MSAKTERFEFQAEVTQLLDLMVHSLYSNKDVFLRELISNASDAIDKRRFEALTDPSLASEEASSIRLTADSEKRTLTLSDNGIGMTRDQVIQNLGTIARSGTKEFFKKLKAAKSADAPELIGQFGVGFYSAFMVAERVEVITRHAGGTDAVRWESKGDGAYTLSESERALAGTSICLHLKATEGEDAQPDFTSEYVIKDLVKRYSDFVAYPILMETEDTSAETKEGEAKPRRDETLNSMRAIWDRSKSEVSDKEYKDFYKHFSHDWQEPLAHLPIKLEGSVEARSILYIPSKAPSDLYSQEMKRGLQLYVRRVFVMDECKDLMPSYLRFIRGVVDAHDLSLNVSREILQKDRQIPIIKKQLVKKVLSTLKDIQKNKPDGYLQFWKEFGAALKEGFLGYETQDHDKLLDLTLATSTHSASGLTSLADYVSRAKEGQKSIYVLAGPNPDTVATSPLLEQFKDKGYEVLLFSDPVDEIWLENAPKYKEYEICPITRGNIELGDSATQEKEKESLESKKTEMKDLLSSLETHLAERVKEVSLSNRLTSSASCLVAGENDPNPRMQKILEQMGQKPEKILRRLELNPNHAVIKKLATLFAKDPKDTAVSAFAEILLGQAYLAEGVPVPDAARFNESLANIMVAA